MTKFTGRLRVPPSEHAQAAPREYHPFRLPPARPRCQIVTEPMGTILSLLLCTWEIGATAYGYSVPDQPDFVMLVAPADVQWFHLEGRYNYEGLDTGSMFCCSWVATPGGGPRPTRPGSWASPWQRSGFALVGITVALGG